MKTRIVTFTYGTAKNAKLEIPAEPCSLYQAAQLIIKSYLEHMFRPGCGLMSDEVLVHSIGRSNFFAGALGGWETRLSPEDFKILKDTADCDMAIALAVVRFRQPGISFKEAYLQASKNEALEPNIRKSFALLASSEIAA